MSGLATVDLSRASDATAREVDQICRETGFLAVEGHGVSRGLIEDMRAVSRAFFDLSLEMKMKVAMPFPGYPYGYSPFAAEALARSLGDSTLADLKETFSIGPEASWEGVFEGATTLWPDAPDGFARIWRSYFREMGALAARILALFARALALPADYFSSSIDRHASALRALRYPELGAPGAPGQLRAGAHSDYGSVTIVLAEPGSRGLEIRAPSGLWEELPVKEGVFIVNVGDLLARWSNDRWVSTIHRVTASAPAPERQSIAFFHLPNWDAENRLHPDLSRPERALSVRARPRRRPFDGQVPQHRHEREAPGLPRIRGLPMSFLSISLLLLAPAAEYARPELLVDTAWVEEHLNDPNVRVVDTRTRGYEASHLPGAVWLDIEASRDAANPPSFLPNLDDFVETLERLGISNETLVVFYDDRAGIYGTRPWVLLQMLGHEKASILDGGWSKWSSEGRPVSTEPVRPAPGRLLVRPDSRWIATADEVAAAIGRSGIHIVDSRTPDEVSGKDLRGNPRGGAVPSATAIYWEETLEGQHQTFKPASELAELFGAAGLAPDEEVITYCQGGGRAAHELFVLYLMGYDDVRLYLGSWEDWSRREDLPVAKE